MKRHPDCLDCQIAGRRCPTCKVVLAIQLSNGATRGWHTKHKALEGIVGPTIGACDMSVESSQVIISIQAFRKVQRERDAWRTVACHGATGDTLALLNALFQQALKGQIK